MARGIRKGIITAVDDTKGVQRVQVQTGPDATDTAPDIDRFQAPGMTHHPRPHQGAHGAEAILAETSPGVEAVIATDDRRARPTGGAAGDTVLYGTHSDTLADNARVECLADGVEVKGQDLKVEKDAVVSGTVDAAGYKAGGTVGKTGVLTIIATIAGAPVTLAVVTIKGGIVTGVTPTSPTLWAGD